MSAGSAVPSQAKMLPREIEENSIILKRKPGASIFYSKVLRQQNETRGVLIVFLNGLMTDKSSWLPVMTGIIEESKAKRRDIPSMLAYDRYGQGLTEDRDPQDMGKEQGHGHDVADAAKDLHDLIHQLAPNGYRDIVLVGNSIGCAIARLYAADHSVSAVLLLDSIMANSNFDLWPDPDAPGFDKASLPEDVTVEALREQRAKFLAIFRPDIPNREGLSRRDLPKLLPRSDEPKLRGASGRPFLTVIGHDFETFAEEGLRVSPLRMTSHVELIEER